MDFNLTSEQRMAVESAQKMAARDIQPVLDAHDPDTPLPKEAMKGLLQICAGQGLTSARVPDTTVAGSCSRARPPTWSPPARR